MLSKTQFTGAVKRLQAEFTPSHIITMLKKALSKNDNGLNSEEFSFLSSLEQRLDNQTVLDRKRAENYLSKSLYNQNYSNIAHTIKAKDTPWTTLATKFRLYGAFLEQLDPKLSCGSKLVDKVRTEWGMTLQSISVDGFNISHTSFEQKFENEEYGIVITHGAMRIQFSDIKIDCEFIFFRDGYSSINKNFPNGLIVNCKVNGKPMLEYLQGSYTDADLEDADILSDHLALFAGVSIDIEPFYDGETNEYSSTEVSLNNDNFEFIMQDMKLSDYASYAITNGSLLLYRISILKSNLNSLIYDGRHGYAPDQREFDIKADGWISKCESTTEDDEDLKKGTLTFLNKESNIIIEYHFTPYGRSFFDSQYFKLTINGKVYIEDSEFTSDDSDSSSYWFIKEIINAYKFIQLVEMNK